MGENAVVAEVLTAHAERLPLKAPFRISRGVKTHAEVVVAEVRDGDRLGLGECVPYARYGETPDTVLAALAEASGRIARGEPARAVAAAMPAGAARNALDCALRDLEARRSGKSVAARLGRQAPGPMATAVTISLDAPEAMAAAAVASADAPLLKVKLDADDPGARLLAVARAAPGARLIVDPNEGWTLDVLMGLADLIARLPVAMVEQPLPADADAALAGLAYPAPLCADESVHTAADVTRVADRYQVVNVKLDKAGGLTEALAMAAEARRLGLGLMAGCMVSSSLAIAPALWIGAGADAVDLDGPWWLTRDRPGGCRIERGVLHPPDAGFWGDPGPRP
ncbi:N-acetyl-D-Glu racemase DgcA [Phenylobacterium sp. SCN 70-31]|uniref:N-acetyl-D-Glu racemase DgcA n=1 Tax=Phenylobacterium sp. SCN 70-31 TaxID=1660129 RepID=UPI00086E6377|nr:N-acetyl-D-Glu racemase DgcA [Phenylobacterium sp. SCN 70-31]ODT86845.1 MAG: dipeptide epimerase [Phenylobacterium sp. SCN 70-31]